MRRKIPRLATQILDQKRHAAKRAHGQAARNAGAGDRFLNQHHGVQGGVQPFDRSKRMVQQFHRADLAGRDQSGQRRGVQSGKLVHRPLPLLRADGAAEPPARSRSTAPRDVAFSRALGPVPL